jgi:hypothetical protein
MTNQQKIEERKAEREVINHVRAIRRQIGKEQEGMTVHEKTLYTRNSLREFFIKKGYTLKLADGTTIP